MVISPENTSDLVTNKLAKLNINGITFEIPIVQRAEQIPELPRNFFIEIPNKLFRGSWPTEKIEGIKALGVAKIISLYSSNDQKELAMLPALIEAVSNAGLEHVIVDIKDNLDLLNAAMLHYTPQELSYVHCQAGANRTGLFCLVSNLKEQLTLGNKIEKNELIKILERLLKGGYDYDKEKYLIYLNEIMKLAIERGLLSADLFG